MQVRRNNTKINLFKRLVNHKNIEMHSCKSGLNQRTILKVAEQDSKLGNHQGDKNPGYNLETEIN